MRLLFDENVSHKLVGHLTEEFPGSAHVRDIRLRGAEDQQIWNHARAERFDIVSRDTDFRERQRIERFDTQQETSLLILSIGPSSI